jgi:hypothetical protein
MESILTSIKKMLGIAEEYEEFDPEIIMHINSVFTTLMQLGVGPSNGFYIEDAVAEWTDFIEDMSQLQAVKTYVYLKVRLLFDPTSLGSATLAAYERQVSEYEWRLNVIAETGKSDAVKENILDYTKLKNLPTINGEPLVDNYDEKDPNVIEMTESDIAELWNEHFDN